MQFIKCWLMVLLNSLHPSQQGPCLMMRYSPLISYADLKPWELQTFTEEIMKACVFVFCQCRKQISLFVCTNHHAVQASCLIKFWPLHGNKAGPRQRKEIPASRVKQRHEVHGHVDNFERVIFQEKIIWSNRSSIQVNIGTADCQHITRQDMPTSIQFSKN